jgi:serine/threonine-protein kinase
MVIVGPSVPVLQGVIALQQGAADIALAANGSLVYVPDTAGGRTVAAVDREGHASRLPGLSLDAYRDVRVSPDGAQMALGTQDDVWTYHFRRQTLSRVTTDPGPDRSPLWTLDGKRIVYTARRSGYPELFSRAADGSGNDERFLSRDTDLLDLQANGWSADGQHLLFAEVQPSHQCSIGRTGSHGGFSTEQMLIANAFCNWFAGISPDGHLVAYESNMSGRDEIYVERYPDLGNRQRISIDGGSVPVWSRNGRELFFAGLDGRQVLAASVQSGPALDIAPPHPLFKYRMDTTLSGRPYDVMPDGRFVIIGSSQAEEGVVTASNLVLIQNWTEELKQLVPNR